jgi:glycosyltransferase involved in cell wall biosynthesis
MLLPVLDATASNALLEAMAAGCPVISTRSTPLVDEYLPDDGDCFKAGDYDGAADRLLRYVGNRSLRAARSATLIRRAADFDWAPLKRRYATAYAAVAQAAYASTI